MCLPTRSGCLLLAILNDASGYSDYDDSWSSGIGFGGMQPLWQHWSDHVITPSPRLASSLDARKYLIIGGLAILCWKGIIPVQRMETWSAETCRCYALRALSCSVAVL